MKFDGTVLAALVLGTLGGIYIKDAMNAAMRHCEFQKQRRHGFKHAALLDETKGGFTADEKFQMLQQLDYTKPFDQGIATYLREIAE